MKRGILRVEKNYLLDMLPGILTVCIFVFIGSWRNFFVLCCNRRKNSQQRSRFTSFLANMAMWPTGGWPAYSVLYMMSTFILYYLVKNYMSEGFTMSGATKG
jgi:multiple sugar transport system permease protein